MPGFMGLCPEPASTVLNLFIGYARAGLEPGTIRANLVLEWALSLSLQVVTRY